MYCTNCGEQMNDNQAICLKCGVAKNEGKGYCPNCGASVAENAAVCLSCGVAIENKKSGNDSNYLNGQDKLIMALVCFFLGGIGIHNFIMGETKKGIFKIVMCFVCGLSAIFALIDFVKILMGSYVVNPDALI